MGDVGGWDPGVVGPRPEPTVHVDGLRVDNNINDKYKLKNIYLNP